MNSQSRNFRIGMVAMLLAAGATGVAVVAQIDGAAERGVVPTDNQSAFEVNDIMVDVYGKTADQARFTGWREAQRKGWRMLWQKTHGGNGPALGDAMLDSMVSGIIIEDEQIGPNRYVARLGVLFDRVRAAQLLGVSGNYARSAPLLVLPVLWSGGAGQTFEQRTEWQKAWARFRAGQSPIDYVRPSGTGADPLLLNAAQTGRRGRMWWRGLLDQYGAADVLVPQARLERLYPGGPVIGYFSARYGPDSRLLQTFQLRAETSAGIPAMMDAAVKKIDAIYGDALSAGKLAPDPSLILEEPMTEEEREALEKAAEEARAAAEANKAGERNGTPVETVPVEGPDPTAPSLTTIIVPVSTPDVASVGAAEAAVRNIPGVRSASITSLALGGTSMMRVTFEGDPDAIRSAVASRTAVAPRTRQPEPEAPRELTKEEKRKAEKEAREAERAREKQEKREREEQKKREKAERKAREKAERESEQRDR